MPWTRSGPFDLVCPSAIVFSLGDPVSKSPVRPRSGKSSVHQPWNIFCPAGRLQGLGTICGQRPATSFVASSRQHAQSVQYGSGSGTGKAFGVKGLDTLPTRFACLAKRGPEATLPFSNKANSIAVRIPPFPASHSPGCGLCGHASGDERSLRHQRWKRST
jgi:hypothetical protein